MEILKKHLQVFPIILGSPKIENWLKFGKAYGKNTVSTKESLLLQKLVNGKRRFLIFRKLDYILRKQKYNDLFQHRSKHAYNDDFLHRSDSRCKITDLIHS